MDRNNIIKRRRSISINIIKDVDDFVILHENELVIKKSKEFIQKFLSTLGLKSNEDKTQIRHTLNWFENKPLGFDFLGFNIRQYRIGKYSKRKTKASLLYQTLRIPSKSKIKKHYKSIKEIIKNTRKTEVLLMELHPKIIGWAIYYSTVDNYKTFKWLNNVYYYTKENRNRVFGI